MNKTVSGVLYWLGRYVQLQLFMSLISLPFLICWGLPISALSLVGNLLFGQVLALFLLFSSYVFFAELLSVSNGWAIYVLEQISYWWMRFLRYPGNQWLFPFYKPAYGWLVIIPLVAVGIIWYKPFRPLPRSIVVLSVAFIFILVFLYCAGQQTVGVRHISRLSDTVTIVYSPEKTVVIDPGASGGKTRSWVEYVLIPELAQLGRMKVDTYIILKPSSMVFGQVAFLSSKIPVASVCIPQWCGNMSFSLWKQIVSLYLCIKKRKGNISYIGAYPVRLLSEPNVTVEVSCTGRVVKGPGCIYYEPFVSILVNGKQELNNQAVTSD